MAKDAIEQYLESEFKKMCPKLGDPDKVFRITIVPNLGELSEVVKLVGGTQVQIVATINLEDIANDDGTEISSFNTYGYGVLKDTTGIPFFASPENITTSKRLTYKHNNIKVVRLSPTTFNEAKEEAKKTESQTLKNTGIDNYSAMAANNPTSTTDARIEMFVGSNESSATDFTGGGLRDQYKTMYTTTSATQQQWLKPTSAKTDQLIDMKNSKMLIVNGFRLNVPNYDTLKNKINTSPGFNSISLKFITTFGTYDE